MMVHKFEPCSRTVAWGEVKKGPYTEMLDEFEASEDEALHCGCSSVREARLLATALRNTFTKEKRNETLTVRQRKTDVYIIKKED